MSYKLGIVGSRVWTSKAGQVWNKKITNPKQFAFDQLDAYVAKHGKPSLVISGGAKGADTYGVQWAQARGIRTKEYRPDQRLINTTGFRHAAMTRNTDIVNSSDRVVAFWDRKSRGTRDTLVKAWKSKPKKFDPERDLFYVGD
tara:strand:- start:62 stop:490 length:429 start_codon:yes stop_codon:yes gene_type:complete